MPNIPAGSPYDSWIASGSNLYVENQFDLKIDRQVTSSNRMSARYSESWTTTPYNCFGNYIDPCAGGPNQTPTHLFVLEDIHTFNRTTVLNATLGFTRGAERIFTYPPMGISNAPSNPLGNLGFPGYLNDAGFMGVPSIFIGGGYFSAGYSSAGSDPYGNYKQGQDTGELTVTLNKQLGTHELIGGFDGRLHQMNYIQTNAPNGIFTFGQHGSSMCPGDVSVCGGDAMATFMVGFPNDGAYYEIQEQIASENYQYAGYIQDNWRTTAKLTLNLGLRYELTLPRTERHNRQNWFDPNVNSPLSVPGLGTLKGGEVFASPSQRTIVNTDWTDWQPLIGFAYQFTPNWAVRGGFGAYYSQSRSGVTGVAP